MIKTSFISDRISKLESENTKLSSKISTLSTKVTELSTNVSVRESRIKSLENEMRDVKDRTNQQFLMMTQLMATINFNLQQRSTLGHGHAGHGTTATATTLVGVDLNVPSLSMLENMSHLPPRGANRTITRRASMSVLNQVSFHRKGPAIASSLNGSLRG